jgi:hypothetical protein
MTGIDEETEVPAMYAAALNAREFSDIVTYIASDRDITNAEHAEAMRNAGFDDSDIAVLFALAAERLRERSEALQARARALEAQYPTANGHWEGCESAAPLIWEEVRFKVEERNSIRDF